MKKICMVVQDPSVKGGIAAVVNGYRGSKLEKDYNLFYVESYKDGTKLEKLMKGIQGYIHFVKIVLFNRPQLVHVHSSFGPSFYRKIPFILISKCVGIPVINHIHGADFNEFYDRASHKKKQLIKYIYGKCNALIALSPEWKERLSKVVDPERITIIENYSVVHESEYIEKIRRDCNYNVLFLGEIGKRKGCYDIPRIIKLVSEKIPEVKFVLCGAGSITDENAIKKAILDLGIQNHVILPGWVRAEEKEKVLKDADVFLLPSYNEGMPMSILDAMGYGLPVISTNVGGIPKIVHNGVNGLCCTPGDIDTIAKGIIELLTDNDRRVQASKESISIIKNGYSFEKHIEKLEMLYEMNLK